MSVKFPEYKEFNLSQINKDILKVWEEMQAFEKSLEVREGHPDFVFYEGPPSANGKPGIHHVMARTIKDLICRYKTMKGFKVNRKAGWDTHGLPVELGVEKKLGITKENIGKTISVEQYNRECRSDVMQYTDQWADITNKMGYWVDMENAYITYENKYIESLWWALKELYTKGLLYKGYSIQPYSPAAGTGLSTHELNQPGCYREVKDTTVVAQFKVIRNDKSEFLFEEVDTDLFFLAWTTTPWTLLSNTALAVGANIDYVKVRSLNPYTGEPITVVLAKPRLDIYFDPKNKELQLSDFKKGDKKIPFQIIGEFKGTLLSGVQYDQLLPFHQPEDGDAFRVIVGDFVTTEDGTGIVHIAPSFGADDFRVAKQNGIGSLTLVDRQGKFVDGCGEFTGKFVKNAFDISKSDDDETVDVQIAVKLKLENRAFRVEKYAHTYPHCWRTDKPVLYYPLDSWFVRTTAVKDRMIELNQTINWKPESTGTGRFGKWLENLQDWNLSRSRYWGTPLPVWVTEDREEIICIGSMAELKTEIHKSVLAGFMDVNPLADFVVSDFSAQNYNLLDLHRPFVDQIFLVSPTGQKMTRETDLVDVWFDSGAMPYAQVHYPFENKKDFYKIYPANFIAEGVDQTRGWFFTLHALATMLFDSVAFRNVVSNGLVLDKNGIKMAKRLGNAVDPFEAIEKYGSDPVRWYMVTNASPWDNLKFDIAGVEEVKRKFFGTLYNTYSFFALYANIDGFNPNEKEIPVSERPEIDRWVISLLNTLVKDVESYYEDYEPTKAGRAIQDFVCDHLSNWYVRLNRKRYWLGQYNENKASAYQTLYACLSTVAKLAAPIAPFYMDALYRDLNADSNKSKDLSVHLLDYPLYNEAFVDTDLEQRMQLAQQITSMVLALRKKVSLKVRQPLSKIMIPVLNDTFKTHISEIAHLILSEVNVKSIEFLTDTEGIFVKSIKANFKLLGPKYSKQMKAISSAIQEFTQTEISLFERDGKYPLLVDGKTIELSLEDVEIQSEDIPGMLVANEGGISIALDVTLTPELKEEGVARELVNRIQNLRKDTGLDVTDKITVCIAKHESINLAVEHFGEYIGAQTLATSVHLLDQLESNIETVFEIEIDAETKTWIKIIKN